MPAVVIKPGAYWLGNPKLVDPNWVESPSCTYELNGLTFHAFMYKSGTVAAVPMAALPEDVWENIQIAIRPDVVIIDEVSIKVTKPKGKKSVIVSEPSEIIYKTIRRLRAPFANTLTTFEEETLFYENHGDGKIGGIEL